MPTVFDITDLAELTDFARNDVPKPSQFSLSNYLPDVTIEGLEVQVNTQTRTNRAAGFRAFDTETPIGKRDTATSSKTKILPISQKLPVGEYETIQLEIAKGGSGGGIVSAIYDDVAINAAAIQARAELARGDLLNDGKLTLSNENGLTLEYDAGVDSSHLVSTLSSWATVASSDPILDLRTWADVYTDDAGEPPFWALTSRRVISLLLRTASIRTLLSSLAGAPAIVTIDQLNNVLAAHGLPMLVAYDARVDVAGVATRPIPDDKVIFLPENGRSLGRTVWGITAESLELTNAKKLGLEDAPGVVATVQTDGDPVTVWSKCAATVMPVIDDPTKILVADVIL